VWQGPRFSMTNSLRVKEIKRLGGQSYLSQHRLHEI
jgi:hypothetical protein